MSLYGAIFLFVALYFVAKWWASKKESQNNNCSDKLNENEYSVFSASKVGHKDVGHLGLAEHYQSRGDMANAIVHTVLSKWY